MRRFLLILLLSIVVLSAACVGSGNNPPTSTSETSTPPSSSSTTVTSSTSSPGETSPTETSTPEPQRWNMTVVWNISTVGIPFMDMSPDGSLSAVIDWNNHIVYLVKPDGTAVSFDVQGGNDDVEPVISGGWLSKTGGFTCSGATKLSVGG